MELNVGRYKTEKKSLSIFHKYKCNNLCVDTQDKIGLKIILLDRKLRDST